MIQSLYTEGLQVRLYVLDIFFMILFYDVLPQGCQLLCLALVKMWYIAYGAQLHHLCYSNAAGVVFLVVKSLR